MQRRLVVAVEEEELEEDPEADHPCEAEGVVLEVVDGVDSVVTVEVEVVGEVDSSPEALREEDPAEAVVVDSEVVEVDTRCAMLGVHVLYRLAFGLQLSRY
jgi:hypothetical protein